MFSGVKLSIKSFVLFIARSSTSFAEFTIFMNHFMQRHANEIKLQFGKFILAINSFEIYLSKECLNQTKTSSSGLGL